MYDALVEPAAERTRKQMCENTHRKGFERIEAFVGDHLSVVADHSKFDLEKLDNTLDRVLDRAFRNKLSLGGAAKSAPKSVSGKSSGNRDDEYNADVDDFSSDEEGDSTKTKKRKLDGSTAKAASSSKASKTTAAAGRASSPTAVLGSLSDFLESDHGIEATLSVWDSPPKPTQLKLKHILQAEPILIDKVEGKILELTRTDWGQTIETVLPKGQKIKFPKNCFATMVYTGAKGSKINHSQIGCLLGQQELEGRRVPLLPTYRTLPSFAPYDLAARAGGYVTDRFLTGVRAQEFYFHCMAGREGLIDTAVKTSRSGYLQRCLVKHLETLVVAYDGTVRDTSDNSVIQFLYGEDGIDVTKSAFLNKFANLHENACNVDGRERTRARLEVLEKSPVDCGTAGRHMAVRDGLKGLKAQGWAASESVAAAKAAGKAAKAGKQLPPKEILPQISGCMVAYDASEQLAELKKLQVWYEEEFQRTGDRGFVGTTSVHAALANARKEIVNAGSWRPYDRFEPTQHCFPPGSFLGSVSEKFHDSLLAYCKKADFKSEQEKEDFILFSHLKYQSSLAAPGEAVGVLAAQGMGEPSTQMTLNTFHLAGHGGANVTLGKMVSRD